MVVLDKYTQSNLVSLAAINAHGNTVPTSQKTPCVTY